MGAEVTPSPFSMANTKPLRETRNPLKKALLGLSPEFQARKGETLIFSRSIAMISFVELVFIVGQWLLTLVSWAMSL